MEIIIASQAGFCLGVDRAMHLAINQLDQPEGECFTLGPLVHNQAVAAYLNAKGIPMVECVENLLNGRIVISSHGVGPEIIEKAETQGLTVIDATCPFVKKIHRIVGMLYAENYDIIIFGDAEHSETQGILGWCHGEAVVVSSLEEVNSLPVYQKLGIISQTTKNEQEYIALVHALIPKAKEIRYYNTICRTTRLRQKEAVELSRQVDLMIVIGDESSSNTRALVEECGREGVKTLLIQSAQDLFPELFQTIQKVGVTAGASTPDWIIKEVIEKMTQFEDGNKNEICQETCCQPTDEALKPTADIPEDSSGCSDCSCCAQSEEANTDDAAEAAESEESALETSEDTFAKMEAAMAEAELPGKGDIVKGIVIQVLDDEVMVDVGGKSEGIIPVRELSSQEIKSAKDVYQVGDEVEVLVLRWDDDGTVLLSKKKVENMLIMQELERIFESGGIVEGTITDNVKGGMLVNVGVGAFLPASHVDINFTKNLDEFVGKTFNFKIIEFNKNKKRGSQIVVSRKEILENERNQAREAFWNTIQEGQTVQGKIKRLVDYGAFVDLGGFEGLLHVSEMDHARIDKPENLLKEGDELELFVLSVDRDKERVSLSRKKLLKSPWEVVLETIHEGDIIDGTVMRMTTFGAFVEIIPGVDGLVHISQIAHQRINRPEDVLTKGQNIKVKVLNIDQTQKRIGLSIKEVEQDTEKAETETYLQNQEEEAAAED